MQPEPTKKAWPRLSSFIDFCLGITPNKHLSCLSFDCWIDNPYVWIDAMLMKIELYCPAI